MDISYSIKIEYEISYREVYTMNMNQHQDTSHRCPLPPHQPPPDAAEYLATVSEEERQLVKMAIERLGSSYFMEKSHGYLAWKASKSKK